MESKSKEPIGKYISGIYRKRNSFISKEVAKYGLGYGQVMFLIQLYKKDGISQEELSQNLSIDKGTTCRAVKKLVEQGFLTRERDEHDKRAYKLYLTEKSKEIKNEVFQLLYRWEKSITTTISQEEVEVLRNLLKKVWINQNV